MTTTYLNQLPNRTSHWSRQSKLRITFRICHLIQMKSLVVELRHQATLPYGSRHVFYMHVVYAVFIYLKFS